MPLLTGEQNMHSTKSLVSARYTRYGTRRTEHKELERLCRYISRPAGMGKCLSFPVNGNVHYLLKTPWRG